jgi:hypothetical protein
MAHKKSTGSRAVTHASRTLSSKSTGKNSKAAAGSALSQTGSARTTSAKAATPASKTLTDGRTSKVSKSAAGSALAQTHRKSKKK